jgi:hypothetical protein
VDWIQANPQLAVALTGTFFAVVGYYYRAWREKQENLREALYLLLEIWHRSSAVSNAPIKKLFDVLIARIRVRIPDVPFSEQEEAATRAYFSPILERTIQSHAMDGIEGLHGAYDKVIQLISRTDPLFAYDLDSASSTKRRLAFLDEYLQEAFGALHAQGGAARPFTDSIRVVLKDEAHKDAMNQLEKNLRRLGARLGPLTWLKIMIRIVKRRNFLRNGPSVAEFDQLIENVLLPAIMTSSKVLQPTDPASGQRGG